MRGSRTLIIGVGAAALAGLVAALAASAAGFTLSQSTSTTTEGFSTTTSSSTVTSTLTLEQINAALAALAGGPKTIGGPGTFLVGVNGESRIYEVQAPMPLTVCVTVRNLSNGEIRLSSSTAASVDVMPLETRSACIGAPMAIQLTCRQGTLCEAVWRVDRG